MCFDSSKYLKEKFEDTTGVIRIRKSKNDRSHYDKKIKKKRETMIYNKLHRKLKIE